MATARPERTTGTPPPASSASPTPSASGSVGTTHAAENQDVVPAALAVSVPELAVLERSLAELVVRGPPRPILLFLDGLTALELAAVAAALVRARAAVPRGSGGRVVLAATLAAPDDDDGPPDLAPGLGEHVLPVRLPPLTKPESTCIIYSLARRHGPHLLDRPVSVLMGLYKPQSSHPRCSLTLALRLAACMQVHKLAYHATSLQARASVQPFQYAPSTSINTYLQ